MGTIDRRPYLTATALTQDLLDECQDNLANRLEMIIEIDTPTGIERLSDRAKYVGNYFYSNRVQFPEIERTIGDFLSGVLEFSSLEISINNTDKRFSDRLPGGANFAGWVNREVVMKIGLGEIAASYTTVFRGNVTDISGFQRDTSSFTLICRNKFDAVNISLPNQLLIEDDFPDIEDDFIGVGAPVIYGDWTVDLRPEGSEVPAYPVNGKDPLVNGSLDPVDPGAGNTPLRLVLSSTPIKFFDDTTVLLKRGTNYYTFASSDINVVPLTDNRVFDITQKNLLINAVPWVYATGDTFFVRVIGVDLGAYDDNIVEQGRDVLTRFAGQLPGDFHSSWDYFRDKAAPAQSAIANIKSRIWFQETAKAIELVASLFEQVRLEPFIDRDNKWHLNSLHFDEIEPSPDFSLKAWDIAKSSFKPMIDERLNFNIASADYDFNPAKGENRLGTATYGCAASQAQAGRDIRKLITFPNLYKAADVEYQLIEMLRLTSGFAEFATTDVTSRSFLRDLGEVIRMSFDIGSIEFDSSVSPIVGMIRTLRYIPGTMSIGLKIWLFQMINFPGYVGPTGTVGGYDIAITKLT
jgi:hypothetical protein